MVIFACAHANVYLYEPISHERERKESLTLVISYL